MLLPTSKQAETYIELLHRSINLYQYAFKKTFWLALLLATIIFTPRLLLSFITPILSQEVYSVPGLLIGLIIYISLLWMLAANFWHMHCIYNNKKDSFVGDLKIARKKMLYILMAAVSLFVLGAILSLTIYGAYWLLLSANLLNSENAYSLYIGSTILFLTTLLAVYMSALFYFYLPLIVIKNDKPISSLLDSARLAWGNVWRILSMQLTPWAVYSIILIIIKILIGFDLHIYLINDFTQDAAPTLLATLVHLAIFALFIPWSIAAIIVQLHDLELRKKIKEKINACA